MFENAFCLGHAGGEAAAGTMPSSVTMTSSPGSTSRTYWRAADRTRTSRWRRRWSRPGRRPHSSMRPMHSGRKPRGSRAAKMRSRVIITMENAPSTCRRDCPQCIDQRSFALECAMSCTMISESACRLEGRAVTLQPRPRVAQVHQVAVVRNRNQPLGALHANRLRIQQRRVARGRVTCVANGHAFPAAFPARRQ
jgi:hypothetical protein